MTAVNQTILIDLMREAWRNAGENDVHDELRKLGVEQTIIDMLDKDYDLERFAGQHPEGVVQEAMLLVFPVAIPEFNNVGR